MQGTATKATRTAAVLAALVLWPGLAAAQPLRALVPVPSNADATVTATIETVSPELRIGSLTTICFQASRAGFVSVWNIATSGAAGLVYPNALGAAAATRIEGARRTCVGTAQDPFRFRVDGPPGTEDLYLLWTARAELQPAGPGYADASALSAAVASAVAGAERDEWANAKTTYDIVPALGAVSPALPTPLAAGSVVPGPAAPGPAAPSSAVAPASRGRVLVLALGANVGRLVKTNQDAVLFARTVVEMFGVARGDVRVIGNGTKADFRGGMEWLRRAATPQDLVFIYFSGHGGRIRDPSRTSSDGYDEYLVPYDFEVKRPQSLRDAVFSQELAGWINALPTDNVIVVADACHSAGVYRSIEGDVLGARSKLFVPAPDADLTLPASLAPPLAPPLAHALAPGATRAAGGAGRITAKGLLLAAAQREQSALETGDGALFTMALLQEMRAARGGTLADTFQRASDLSRARSRGRQTPTAVGPIGLADQVTFTR